MSRPTVPLRSAFWHQEEFYADPAVALDRRLLPMRLAVMLTPMDLSLPQHVLGGIGTGSWTFFAGAPSRPVGTREPWPRRDPAPGASRGMPLTHVLQVDLYGMRLDQGEGTLAETGLPTSGLLQFFHDGETYGDEAADADAWTVRWVPRQEAEASGWEPTPRPDDMDPGAYGPAVAMAHEISPSIPTVHGNGVLPPDMEDRYVEVYEQLEEHPYYQNVGRRPKHSVLVTPWSTEHEPPPQPSRLLGFSGVPVNDDYDAVVREHLPLEPGDEHLLLADINPLQFGEEANGNWFHGGRHVEYWIRRSDLLGRRFDRAWALIRTDH